MDYKSALATLAPLFSTKETVDKGIKALEEEPFSSLFDESFRKELKEAFQDGKGLDFGITKLKKGSVDAKASVAIFRWAKRINE